MKKRVAIVGGGISGLSLAYFLKDVAEVTVFEGEEWGGKAITRQVDKYRFEEGVNGFLDNSPLTLQLAQEIGLKPIPAGEESKARFIYDGKLYKLPNSPKEFLKSDLLPFSGKVHLLKDLWVSKKCEEETISQFVRRRLGKWVLNRLVTPFVAGVYGATPSQLSIYSPPFNRIKEVECNYGSLIRGMIKLKRGGAPRGNLYSFPYGMGEFIKKLMEKTPAQFENSQVYDIAELKHYDKVILAVPAYSGAEILFRYPRLSHLLQQIEYNPIVVVGLDYKEPIKPKGFGVLTVYMKALGILLDKYMFPNRHGIRVMLGGGRYPGLIKLGERQLVEIAEEGVSKIYHLEKPIIKWIKVHKKGIPVYKVGHSKLVEEIDREAEKIGIGLIGNWKGGVSFNDCIRNSYSLAQKLKQELAN